MIIANLTYHNLRKSNIFTPPVFMDSPRECLFGKEWWYDYNIKDFDYKFNDWAFRGDDYNQYLGKPVNICIGDSFTVNIGGPIEHSWTNQLSKYFDIPTINLGVDGAGNDTINLIYRRACEIFDVQNTFVMYSYFHRRLDDGELTRIATSDNENFKYFEENFIDDAIFTFVPRWAWSDSEIEFISKKYNNNFIDFSKFLKGCDLSLKKHYSQKEYNILKGAAWPDYDEFLQKEKINFEVYVELAQQSNTFLKLLFSNRDGYHLNQVGNQVIADFLYKKLVDKQ